MSIMNHKGGFAGQIFLAAKAKAKKDDYLQGTIFQRETISFQKYN